MPQMQLQRAQERATDSGWRQEHRQLCEWTLVRGGAARGGGWYGVGKSLLAFYFYSGL